MVQCIDCDHWKITAILLAKLQKNPDGLCKDLRLHKLRKGLTKRKCIEFKPMTEKTKAAHFNFVNQPYIRNNPERSEWLDYLWEKCKSREKEESS